jgi:hypothetical protein
VAPPHGRGKIGAALPAAVLFRLALFQPRDKSFTAPEFNRVAVYELPGLLDCLGIDIAAERLKVDKMPVEPDGISPIICHPHLSHRRLRENIIAVGFRSVS